MRGGSGTKQMPGSELLQKYSHLRRPNGGSSEKERGAVPGTPDTKIMTMLGLCSGCRCRYLWVRFLRAAAANIPRMCAPPYYVGLAERYAPGRAWRFGETVGWESNAACAALLGQGLRLEVSEGGCGQGGRCPQEGCSWAVGWGFLDHWYAGRG